jgi:hypothetical protein
VKLNGFVRMISLAVLLLAAFGVGHRYSVSASAQAKQKWEYQIVKLTRLRLRPTSMWCSPMLRLRT